MLTPEQKEHLIKLIDDELEAISVLAPSPYWDERRTSIWTIRTALEDMPESVADQLKAIEHPNYDTAVLQIDHVVWDLTCANCGGVHKLGIDTDELDPCCSRPKRKIG